MIFFVGTHVRSLAIGFFPGDGSAYMPPMVSSYDTLTETIRISNLTLTDQEIRFLIYLFISLTSTYVLISWSLACAFMRSFVRVFIHSFVASSVHSIAHHVPGHQRLWQCVGI